jgi:hypothetical protein
MFENKTPFHRIKKSDEELMCDLVIVEAKKRGNKYCQVQTFGEEVTIDNLITRGYKVERVGMERDDPSVYLSIKIT